MLCLLPSLRPGSGGRRGGLLGRRSDPDPGRAKGAGITRVGATRHPCGSPWQESSRSAIKALPARVPKPKPALLHNLLISARDPADEQSETPGPEPAAARSMRSRAGAAQHCGAAPTGRCCHDAHFLRKASRARACSHRPLACHRGSRLHCSWDFAAADGDLAERRRAILGISNIRRSVPWFGDENDAKAKNSKQAQPRHPAWSQSRRRGQGFSGRTSAHLRLRVCQPTARLLSSDRPSRDHPAR